MPEVEPNVVPAEEMIPFALRLPKRLHRNLKILAALSGVSANTLVIDTLKGMVDKNSTAISKAKEASKLVK